MAAGGRIPAVRKGRAACFGARLGSGCCCQRIPPAPETYATGVLLIEQGDPAEARVALERALSTSPREAADYLPHLYLAIACHMTGDTSAAKRHLAEAEASGAAERSENGRRLLAAERLLLGGGRAPSFRRYDKKAPHLPEAEAARVRREVLSRCKLAEDSKAGDAPWYFHYELGLELARMATPSTPWTR